MQTARSVLGGALLSALLGGCGGGGGSGGAAPAAGSAMSAMAQVGAKAFADVSLSASGRQSCASCHDPAAGHAPANDLASQPGGADLSLSGGRQAPSLRYLATNKPFFFAADGTPTGGFFWDGRAQSLARRCSAVAPRTRRRPTPPPASRWAMCMRAGRPAAGTWPPSTRGARSPTPAH